MRLLTEDEARETWCPMARFTEIDAPGGRLWSTGLQTPHCVAAACALWEWGEWQIQRCVMDSRTIDKKESIERGSIWLKPSGAAPPLPDGEGWKPVGEPRQKNGYTPGVLEQVYERPVKCPRGYCGLKGACR